jgi:uncharacterized iron-regulated protein
MGNFMRILTAGLLLTLGLAGCAPHKPHDSAGIIDTAISTNLDANIQAADFIFLGEKHDNPKHHEIQAALLSQYVSAGDLIVFEMINHEQQPIIDDFISGKINYPELADALQWEKSGWPSWDYYGPLFKTAKAASANILYGSFSKDALMKQSMLRIARPKILSDDQMTDLDAQIRISHCQMLPEKMIRPMSNLQIIKDELMAKQLQKKGPQAKAFLIAGNGHARKDRGVPKHLEFAGISNIFVLGLIEEKSEPAEWELYSQYDAIWVTQSLGKSMDDYCAGLKERFQKKS